MPRVITSAENMEAFGAEVMAALPAAAVVYLCGELGTGKTTFVRGAMRSLGYEGLVKSPTFTVVESYSVNGKKAHHFDLYRISDPEELDFIGLRDYTSENAYLFFEWPTKGQDYIPPASISVILSHAGTARHAVIEGRLKNLIKD